MNTYNHPNNWQAKALSRSGKVLYTSEVHDSRKAAIADAFEHAPKAHEVKSGYGYDGSANIQWHRKDQFERDFGVMVG